MGERRAAEDPPADCGQEDSFGQNEDLRAGDGTSMECLSFQEYCDSGGSRVEADVEECWDKKGRGPVGVRLVDVDKGFGVFRSRLVAKDFKPKSKVNDQEGLFGATPPLELVKMLILKAARGSRNRHARVKKVMFLDVSKAHLYAPMLDEEFVQLPPER